MNGGNISKRLVYMFLVIERKVPFFIKSTNRLFDSFKSKLQCALDIYSVVFKVYEDDLSFVTETKVFRDFIDIEEKVYSKYSKKLEISFQGKADIDLYSLLKYNSLAQQRITVDNYIELLQNRCIIGEPSNLPSYYINRQMSIPVLNQQVLKENDFMFFIFTFPKRAKFKNYKSINLEHYESAQEFYEILGRPCNIITVSDEFNNDYLRRIERLSKNRPYYLLKYIHGDYIILLHTNSSVEMLRSYLEYVSKKDTELVEIYRNCEINIICNNAGMGKSTFLNYIHSKFSSDQWIVHIDLKKYSVAIKKIKTIDELISFSYKCHTEGLNENFHHFFEPLYRKLHHKTVWLIDDYEEINEPNLLELFKLAMKQGFRIWIVARPHLKLEFENVFGALSMELTEFNKEDQEMFIKKYLEQKNKNEDDIKNIIEAIDNIRNLLEDSFIGTCQQTMMLVEICLNHENKWREQGWHIHDIYEQFIKLKGISDSLYIRTISKMALKVFFTNNAF